MLEKRVTFGSGINGAATTVHTYMAEAAYAARPLSEPCVGKKRFRYQMILSLLTAERHSFKLGPAGV